MREENVLHAAPASPWVRALLLGGAALLLFARLGATGLWAPDEPRYGHVAETVRSGEHGPAGLVLLHLNGEPYTQKPPLYYWLAAAAGAPQDRVTELAARLPSALAGVALVALTLAFGARLLGGATGALGAALLLTTFEFAHQARRAQLDVLLALLETLALAAFWRIDRGIGRRVHGQLLLHASLGLAVLTKGPVGFLVPVLVMTAYLAWERRLRDLAKALPWWGPALSLGPGLAWIAAAVALAPPGFFGEAVVENVLGRFFAGTSHARPFYYYVHQLPIESLPWIVLAPAVVWAARRQVFAPGGDDADRRAWRLLLAWVGATFVFFSLSTGKRGIYLLPALPAIALLAADAVGRWVEARRGIPKGFHAATAVLGVALAGVGIGVALRDPLGDARASLVTGIGAVAIVAFALGAQIALGRARARLRLRIAIPVAAVYALQLLVFTVAFPALDPQKSPRAVAEAAAALTPPGERVGLLGDAALTGGLVYYGGRRVAPLQDEDDRAPGRRRHRGRARGRHPEASRSDRLHHARSRLCQHRRVPQRDHLHRRRRGHPALPRLPIEELAEKSSASSRWPTC
jgi:4-amino-4-deoxy-L-arabinose transferase-like glycosyltransferase